MGSMKQLNLSRMLKYKLYISKKNKHHYLLTNFFYVAIRYVSFHLGHPGVILCHNCRIHCQDLERARCFFHFQNRTLFRFLANAVLWIFASTSYTFLRVTTKFRVHHLMVGMPTTQEQEKIEVWLTYFGKVLEASNWLIIIIASMVKALPFSPRTLGSPV